MNGNTPTDSSAMSFVGDVAELKDRVRRELLDLQERRDVLEREVNTALDLLTSTSVGLNGTLVDSEGFPRDDLDHYTIRAARNKVACGQNDLKKIEQDMYDKLGELHDATKEDAALQMALNDASDRQRRMEMATKTERARLVSEMSKKRPFVQVVSSQPGSPSAEAGLITGHRIVQYGSVDADVVAVRGLAAMATETREHEGQPISVWVLDDESMSTELFLVPQKWAGDGLLGCVLNVISS